jgi:hypothetical protein
MMNTFVSQLLTPVNVKISMPFLGVGKERTMVLTCVLTTSLFGTNIVDCDKNATGNQCPDLDIIKEQ